MLNGIENYYMYIENRNDDQKQQQQLKNNFVLSLFKQQYIFFFINSNNSKRVECEISKQKHKHYNISFAHSTKNMF